MSSDGDELAAVVFGGYLYTSSNRGAHWTNRSTGTISGNKNWQGIAMSSDGERLTAVVYGGNIYTSSNEGAAWDGPQYRHYRE